MTVYLYHQLEQELRQLIASGQLGAGEKIPSVRQLSHAKALSKSTVLTALARLEAEGFIEAKPRSGYFVVDQNSARVLQIPETSQPEIKAVPAKHLLMDIMAQGAAFDLLSPSVVDNHQRFDDGCNQQLKRCLARAQRQQSCREQLYYDEPGGNLALRQALAQHISHGGKKINARQLLITSGCQNSLLLALMATTKPGDVVAVESPGFYGSLQLIESLGLKVLELPCDAQTGLSPQALELALQHWSIKALIVTPNFATPMGSSLPEQAKLNLINLAEQYQFAIIEDDIYGDLHFSLQRPRSLYSYDSADNVILCGSFSKSVSRDLRLGWIVAGKWSDDIKRLKLVTGIASSQTLQQGLLQFMQEGSLYKHAKQKRRQLQQQHQELQQLIAQHLSMAVSCSQAEGGLTVWLELPKEINSLDLYNQAKEQQVLLTPGGLFSLQDSYSNFLRLSFAHPWNESRIAAFQKVAVIIDAMLAD